jgi:pimeloyl-ACP methyl ester carboxylesterase
VGGVLILAAAALAAPAAPRGGEPAERPPPALRYDLEAGDRLVYRETLTREGEGRGSLRVVEAEWTSEVLVLGLGRQGAVVGIQRRRRSAELVRARGTDADRAQSKFRELLARRPEVVAEANVFNSRGRALLAPDVEREWPSDLLPFVHEIEALPAEPVTPGQEWRGTHPLGLEFRAEEWEDVEGEPCLRARGALRGDQVVLRIWFSPRRAVLRRLELEGWYSIVGVKFREKLRLDLLERHRGESLDTWLDVPGRRQGALAALLIADRAPVEQERIEALLAVEDDEVRRAALRLLWRQRLPVSTRVLAPLLRSAHPRVRALATRTLDQAPKAEARPLLEARLADSDPFVRDAALQWLRRRLPRGVTVSLRDSASVEGAWEQVARTPGEPVGALTSVAATVRRGGTVADWRCETEEAWPQGALLEQRLPSDLPGARMRVMVSEKWRGQPYVLRVPDEYRGDAPVPLLVYLSGGPGRALLGWTTAREALADTGYLVAFPQASGMWWSDESEEMVRLLVDEMLERFNVDTNRVYLAGFSNGGTGTFFYAARWADRLAAAVSLEGAGKYGGMGVSPPSPGGFGRLPILFVHGDRDRVIDVDCSRESAKVLRRENRDARVELEVLPGRGHDVMLGTDDGLTLAFLEHHRRDPFPREVAFSLDDLRSPRRYWLEVLEKRGGEARVEGRIGDDGVVTVKTKRVRQLRLLLRRELLPGASELRVVVNGREAFRGAPVEDCAMLQRSWHETRDPFRAHSIEITLDVAR